MDHSRFYDFLSTVGHLEPPPNFHHKDTSAYQLSAEFFECIARELDSLLHSEWLSMQSTSGVPMPAFGKFLSFTDYVNDFLAPEFHAVIETIHEENDALSEPSETDSPSVEFPEDKFPKDVS